MDEKEKVAITTDAVEKENKEENVFTHEVKYISPVVYFFMGVGNGLLKGILWLVDLVVSMFTSLWYFLVLGGKGIVKGVVGVYKFFKRKIHQFKNNDLAGRLSYIFFGASNLANHQWVNGFLFLFFEIGYILFMALGGGYNLYMLGTLGTKLSGPLNPDDQFSPWIEGDNSIMILIFGLLTVLSIVIFLYIWNRSINSGYNIYRIKKFLNYDKMTKDNIDFSKKISDEAIESRQQGINRFAFKKSHLEEINNYLASIELESDRDYARYLIYNTIEDAYVYESKRVSLLKRIGKLEARRDNSKTKRDTQLSELVAAENGLTDESLKEKAHIKVEKHKNRTLSISSNYKLKIDKLNNQIREIDKSYTCHGEKQNTINIRKYGKNNNYYKQIAELDSDILFWSNYDKFLAIYNDNLKGNETKNLENGEEIKRLEQEALDKIEKINKKYQEIADKRTDLETKIKQLKQTYDADLADFKQLSAEEREAKTAEAKLNLVEQTTRFNHALNDLPSVKSVKALRKEEISEVKHACARDKKYLKTNFTPTGYAKQCVIDAMLVDYDIEYKDAVYYTALLFDKKTNLSYDAAYTSERINELQTQKNDYVTTHDAKYDGHIQTFKEQAKALLNEKFHISILALPMTGIVLFTILPLIFSILVAFTNYSKGHVPSTQLFTWIGLQNFITLFNPPSNSIYVSLPGALMRTLGWTLSWAVIATFSNYFLGIIVALMINKEGIKFKSLWRTIFVLTIAIPSFISLMSIGVLLKDSGALGKAFSDAFGYALGFGDSLENGALVSKIIIIVVNIWVGIPYTILSTTGILLNIPKDLYESSRVDGAGTVTQFLKITMPYILFVTGPYLITQFVGNINNFNVIFFLTGGGPANPSAVLGLGETDLLITFLYKMITSNDNPQFGIASAVGIVIFIVCSFFSIVMYNKSGAIQEEDQFQ